jgi:hypothetical protein
MDMTGLSIFHSERITSALRKMTFLRQQSHSVYQRLQTFKTFHQTMVFAGWPSTSE